MTRLNETCLTLRRIAREGEGAREGRGTPARAARPGIPGAPIPPGAAAPPFRAAPPSPPGPAPRARRAGHGGLGAAVLLALWALLWGHFLVAIAAPAGRLGAAAAAEAGAPPRLAAVP